MTGSIEEHPGHWRQGAQTSPRSGVIVIPLPREIDMTNAEQAGAALRTAFAEGASIVIGDLTATTFCDSAGIRCLAMVNREAASRGAELRLAVVPGSAVSRVLELMDVVGVLHVYSGVQPAAAGEPQSR
jgi:anti-sigma B factor antagonist